MIASNTRDVNLKTGKRQDFAGIALDYKLKLSSKKLKSGKCQVKFHASIRRDKHLYGYVLVDAEDTLKQVVEIIKKRLDRVKYRDTVHHINLYTIGKHFDANSNFIVFEA